MAKNVLNDIRNLTSMDINNLSKNELVDLVARGSKSLAQNIRRLRNSDVASQSALLSKRDAEGKPVVVERKKPALQKLSKTKLKAELRKIKYTASAKTSSIKGTKKFAKEFKERTGVEYGSITPDAWSKIRRRMEANNNPEYSSDDIITQYEEETNDATNDANNNTNNNNNTANDEPEVEDVPDEENPFFNNVDYL